ncbi:guanine deaminase-like isoform X2 [Patiria miniata]|uniref:Guanine deaminase n=1 Tax=Patiria miniata TaxID=46514 RepID=A0A914A464_PATMI|nr:guanine deaminase-like isoform X2 [Patiria miniata]
MPLRVIQGTLVHAQSANQPLQILENNVIGVDKNKIIFVEPVECLSELSAQHGFELDEVHNINGCFLMPGFVDTHIHAPQYVYTGTAMGLPLLEWLDKYTFPVEAKFDDLKFATDAYHKVVHRTLKNGTTTASYFATIHKEASLKLAEIAAKFGQRAFIGKVNMDSNSPDFYVETTENSIQDTEWFIKQVQSMNNPLVTPIVTPRFAVSCTLELMKKLAELAEKYNLPIQTHLGEILARPQVYPQYKSYMDVYSACNLLTTQTVLAHCIYLDDDEIETLRSHGCGVSHCACSNFSLKSGVLDLRKLMTRDVKVSLGTDVSGGYTPSMLGSIRQSVIASNVQECQQRNGYRSVDFKEMFYLATLGGSKVLGLQNKIGNFEVGKDFDAILVNPEAANSPFDVFHSTYSDTIEDVVQKFLYLGKFASLNFGEKQAKTYNWYSCDLTDTNGEEKCVMSSCHQKCTFENVYDELHLCGNYSDIGIMPHFYQNTRLFMFKDGHLQLNFVAVLVFISAR